MRKILIAIAASGLSIGMASAADLPVRAPAYVPAPAPVLWWNGGYVGANVGYGWSTVSATYLGATGSENFNGVLGGGQIGYNWQWASSPLVLGIEADFQGTDQRNDYLVGGVSASAGLDWFGTVRGRIGYAPGPWMAYFTGGWAYGRFSADATAGGVTVSASDNRSGWTVGGGLEYKFTRNWSAKVEYLYIKAGSVDGVAFGAPFSVDFKNNIARFGVNYHF
ncbi:MAG: porin family protein [Xanthobacteraceae bacterium]|nr:porin family protein [Xanthobacteraceae bacterium]